jgi:DNA polymerase sigma
MGIHIIMFILRKFIIPKEEVLEVYSICQLLEKQLNNQLQLISPIYVRVYGSRVNGFGYSFSKIKTDIDITLLVSYLDLKILNKKEECFFDQLIKIISKFTVSSIEKITATKVPILKFSIKDYSIDLSINNILGIQNSTLLLKYSLFDNRIRSLGVLIKYWANSFELNKVVENGISSYGWIILMLSFVKRNTKLLHERESRNLFNLWKDMIYYFGFIYNYKTSLDIIDCENSFTNRFVIRDPYERDFNLARRVTVFSLSKIKKSFRDTYNLFDKGILETEIPINFLKIFSYKKTLALRSRPKRTEQAVYTHMITVNYISPDTP